DSAGIILVAAPAEETLRAEREFARGALEHGPIHRLGRGIRRNRIDPRAGSGVAIVRGANHGDPAKPAGADHFFGLALRIGADALAAHLHHAFARARRRDNL